MPFPHRNHVDELVEELLEKAEDGIHRMLCDQKADHYRGVDSNRDTEKEIETVVRLFPNLISRRQENILCFNEQVEFIEADAGGEGNFPIQCLAYMYTDDGKCICNVKAASFIALLAQLAIEFGSFEDHERGGLLIDDRLDENTLQNFFYGSHSSYGNDYNQLVQNVFLAQLIRLKQMALFKKEDICEQRLVHKSIRNRNGYFPENRFRFLVESDPTALLQIDDEGRLPLHQVAAYFPIQVIRIVFDYCVRYYPKKKGICLMFTKYGNNNNNNRTPFQLACTQHGRDKVIKDIIQDTMTRYYSEETPLNIVDALLTAAIDDTIHVDCLFYLLRRRPDVLVNLQSGSTTNGDNDGVIDGGSGGGGGGNESHKDDNDGDNDGSDRDDNDNSNHENDGEEEEEDNMLLTNAGINTDADENENDGKRKRKRTEE